MMAAPHNQVTMEKLPKNFERCIDKRGRPLRDR